MPTQAHLNGHLGPESWAQLVDDLCIEAATIIHVTHQHGECLCGTQLLCSHVCDSEVVVGLPNCAKGYCVGHLGEKSGRWGLGDGWGDEN